MISFRTKFICLLCVAALKVILVLLPLLPFHSYAAELPASWTSVRALGMGNAFIAVAEDTEALFYNPANLAWANGITWTVFDPRLGSDGPDTASLLTSLSGSGSGIADTLNNLYGREIWAGAGTKTAFTFPNFGIGAFINTQASLGAESAPNPRFNANYFFDYGVTLGGSLPVIPNILSFGMALRRMNRTGTNFPFGPATLATLDNAVLESEFKRRGNGYGADFGLTLKTPGPVSPTFSLVYKNAGYTTFAHDEGAGAPPRIEPEMALGVSMVIDTPVITITPALDYRFMNRYDTQIGKKLHLGVEFDLPLIDLRAGLHQGYYTLGAGMSLGVLRLDAATYGVELGEYPGQHEDRRYIVQMTFEIGFDPGQFGLGGGSGNSGSGGGAKKRLKQRR